MKNAHWSPFEMCNVVFEIKTPRDIGRQILRHRSFSFQEFSQRYMTVNLDDFIVREARLQDQKNRQSSIQTDDLWLQTEWENRQKAVAQAATNAYEWAIANGIAKECARVVLPEGMTPSVMYMQGSLRSWIHYCQLRTGNGTQLEHADIANAAWEILKKEFPLLAKIEEPKPSVTADVPLKMTASPTKEKDKRVWYERVWRYY